MMSADRVRYCDLPNPAGFAAPGLIPLMLVASSDAMEAPGAMSVHETGFP